MLRIRTILHPTDFSEQSDYALQLACALSRDHGARLVVLHVAAPPIMAYGEGVIPPDFDLLVQDARERLDRVEVPDLHVRTERRFEEGDPTTEILRVAREVRADLIVMGTHGRTGLTRLLMGSVAEWVVREAPCPVLTVKTPFPEAAQELAAAEAGTANAVGVNYP